MGSAQVQGDLWGVRAQDWADLQEGTARPAYEQGFTHLGLGPGSAFLDVGCGTGMAAHLAAERGARVAGLDASSASIALAQTRVPSGTFQVGDMEELPLGDATVDMVTNFNAFQYAASPLKALQEAFRVLKPGGQVAMVTWGQAQQCEHAATLAAVGTCLPLPPPGAGGAFRALRTGPY